MRGMGARRSPSGLKSSEGLEYQIERSILVKV